MKAMRCWWWLALAVSAFLGTAAAKVICATADGFEVCVGGCASKGGCDPNGCTWNSCNQIPCLKRDGEVEYCLKGLGCNTEPPQSGCATADDYPVKCTEPNLCNEDVTVSQCGGKDCKIGFRACCTKSGCANPDQCKKPEVWTCEGDFCEDWRHTCMDASLKRVTCKDAMYGSNFCSLQGGCAQRGCLEGKDCCKGIDCNAANCLDGDKAMVLCPLWLGGCSKKMFGGCEYITCLGTDLKEVNCRKSQGGCAASGGCGEGGCTDEDLCNQIICDAPVGVPGSICLKEIGCADGSGCAWPASTTTTTTATTASTATTTTNTTTTTSTNTTTDAKSTADPTSTPSTTTTTLFTICLFSLLLHHLFN